MCEPTNHLHGRLGVWCGGDWIPMMDAPAQWNADIEDVVGTCKDTARCANLAENEYDVVVVGAGCVGASVARELSKHCVKVLVLEASDDVTQGATKGNSGIVHAGYDDEPGSVRAKFCPAGNQMFPALDRDLKFGFQRNGSLVVARGEGDLAVLEELLRRGKANGVPGLRILGRDELLRVEPNLTQDATAALFAPSAGIVIPFEFTIALAENAAANGVEFRCRREVVSIGHEEVDGEGGRSEEGEEGKGEASRGAASRRGRRLVVTSDRWFPPEAPPSSPSFWSKARAAAAAAAAGLPFFFAAWAYARQLAGGGGDGQAQEERGERGEGGLTQVPLPRAGGAGALAVALFVLAAPGLLSQWRQRRSTRLARTKDAGPRALSRPAGREAGREGRREREEVRCRFVVNAAGLFSDKVAAMVGDTSFGIKPRIGEYLLLKRPPVTAKEEPPLCRHIVFPCPGKMGKGVLVQPTLWGNLCLGPTAHDFANADWRSAKYDEAQRGASKASIVGLLLAKCRELLPCVPPASEAIHSFAGVRAKNSTGDWVVRPSANEPHLIHAAGIDSPGLAGSPAVAVEVIRLLGAAGLELAPNPHFMPKRRPYIVPKGNWKRMDPAGSGKEVTLKKELAVPDPARLVVCRCELVTEAEVLDAIRRGRASCLKVENTQQVRKRTRAGMGWCQGEYCEPKVRALLAAERDKADKAAAASCAVEGRPWPESSVLESQHQYADGHR